MGFWVHMFWIVRISPGLRPSQHGGQDLQATTCGYSSESHNLYSVQLSFPFFPNLDFFVSWDITIGPRSPSPLIVKIKGQSWHSDLYYRCFTFVAGAVQVRSSLTLDLEVTSESGQQPRCQGLSLDLGAATDSQPAQDIVEDLPLERQGLVLFLDQIKLSLPRRNFLLVLLTPISYTVPPTPDLHSCLTYPYALNTLLLFFLYLAFSSCWSLSLSRIHPP